MRPEIGSRWKYRQTKAIYEVTGIANIDCENPLYKEIILMETVLFKSDRHPKILALPIKKFLGALRPVKTE